MSRVSRGRPASMHEVDEATGKAVPGTKMSAVDKHSPPPPPRPSHRDPRRRQTVDSASDSGKSTRTFQTVASTDSAKVMPAVPDAPKPTLPLAQDTAASVPTPTPPAQDHPPARDHHPSPKKAARSESPTKKHRRAPSKTSKRSAEARPAEAATQPQPVVYGHHPYLAPTAAYPYDYFSVLAHPYPHPYPAAADPYHHPAYPAAPQPAPLYAPDRHGPAPTTTYPPEPAPLLRRTSRARSRSIHTVPAEWAYDHDPSYHHPHGYPPYDQPPEPHPAELPSTRQSALASQRPLLPHAHTDLPSTRHSTMADRLPIRPHDQPQHERDPYSRSYDGAMRPIFHVPVYADRRHTPSPERTWREAAHGYEPYPPDRVSRRRSLRRHPSESPPYHRPASMTRPSRSYTESDSLHLHAGHLPRPTRRDPTPYRSRRHSQHVGSSPHSPRSLSRSPARRATTGEARSHRERLYHDDVRRERRSSRHERHESLTRDDADRAARARDYQRAVTGHDDFDHVTQSVRSSYNRRNSIHLHRASSQRSSHSKGSHRGHQPGRQSFDAGSRSSRRKSDVQVEVKFTTKDGRTLDKLHFNADTDLSYSESGDLLLHRGRERSYHGGSSGKSSASSIFGLWSRSRRGSGSRHGSDAAGEIRESRRRSRVVASPILEEAYFDRRR